MEQRSPLIPPARLEPLLNERPHLRPMRPIILLMRRAHVGGRLERRREGGEEEFYELGVELPFYAGSVVADLINGIRLVPVGEQGEREARKGGREPTYTATEPPSAQR